jgi:hypothetical protein
VSGKQPEPVHPAEGQIGNTDAVFVCDSYLAVAWRQYKRFPGCLSNMLEKRVQFFFLHPRKRELASAGFLPAKKELHPEKAY